MGEQGGGIDSDLFGPACIAELADILGIKRDDPRLSAFRYELKEYGAKRRHAIRSMPIGFPIAPFDASLTQRIEWLSTQVIGPAEKLLAGLDEAKRPYFAEWPDEYRLPDRPDLDDARDRIEEIHHHATTLRDNLDDQLSQKIAHTSEMRYVIVTALLDILKKHFPGIKITRGQHDRDLRKTVGIIPDYVRRVFSKSPAVPNSWTRRYNKRLLDLENLNRNPVESFRNFARFPAPSETPSKALKRASSSTRT